MSDYPVGAVEASELLGMGGEGAEGVGETSKMGEKRVHGGDAFRSASPLLLARAQTGPPEGRGGGW